MDHFTNNSVDLLQLPKVTNLVFQPLEHRYKKVLIGTRLLTILVAAVFLYFAFDSFPQRFPQMLKYVPAALIAVYLCFNLFSTVYGFKYKCYALREKDIIYKSGWLWTYMTTAPFNRVQHIRIDQGPIERQINLAKLRIFTAGGSSSDLVIPGLDFETATELKEFIVKKTQEDEEE